LQSDVFFLVPEENIKLQHFQQLFILMVEKRHHYTVVTFLTRKED